MSTIYRKILHFWIYIVVKFDKLKTVLNLHKPNLFWLQKKMVYKTFSLSIIQQATCGILVGFGWPILVLYIADDICLTDSNCSFVQVTDSNCNENALQL